MRIYCLAAAALGWFGLVLQYYIAPWQNSGAALVTATINFFSFFTILLNLLAAAVLTAFGLGAPGRLGRWLTRPAVQGAAALYVAVGGFIYATVLAQLWEPQGWQFIADALLHYVMPVLYLLYWLVGAPKGSLRWGHAALWLILPAVYGLYTLARGPSSGFYPYPFVDAGKLGYAAVIRNMVGMTAGFAVLGLLIVLLDRALGRRRVQA